MATTRRPSPAPLSRPQLMARPPLINHPGGGSRTTARRFLAMTRRARGVGRGGAIVATGYTSGVNPPRVRQGQRGRRWRRRDLRYCVGAGQKPQPHARSDWGIGGTPWPPKPRSSMQLMVLLLLAATRAGRGRRSPLRYYHRHLHHRLATPPSVPLPTPRTAVVGDLAQATAGAPWAGGPPVPPNTHAPDGFTEPWGRECSDVRAPNPTTGRSRWLRQDRT